MKKNLLTLAAGVAMTAMIINGCSGQAGGNATTAVETEVTTEAETKTEAETEKESEKTESNGEIQGEAYVDIPMKVWGTVIEAADGTILVDSNSENGAMGEVLLMIDPDHTYVLDGVDGFPVDLKDVEKGDFEAYLGPAMTMSLPPQTTPYVVIVNIPEGIQAPQYVVAADKISEEEGVKVLTAADGTEYTLTEEVTIIPFLTRNMVQLEDIEKDSRCLVWLNDENEVERIVLFAE